MQGFANRPGRNFSVIDDSDFNLFWEYRIADHRYHDLEEKPLARVINLNSVGTQRKRLTKSVVIALRELMKQQTPDSNTYDLAAYISLALHIIHETVDQSVTAWEKRGYWLKADRFRLQWEWSEKESKEMKNALFSEDWAQVALVSARVAEKLNDVEVSKRHRFGTPWVGAWDHLKESSGDI